MMLYVAVMLAYEYEKHLLSSEQNGLCASKHDHFSTYSSLLNKKHSFSYKILPCWMHFCSVQNNLLYQDLFCWLLMWCRTGSAWLDMKIYTLYVISWSAVINLKVPFWSHKSTSVIWKNKTKDNKQTKTNQTKPNMFMKSWCHCFSVNVREANIFILLSNNKECRKMGPEKSTHQLDTKMSAAAMSSTPL